MRLILAALAATFFAGPALADPMQVGIDQSTRVRLTAPARDVLVGNPAIVDVTMLDTHNLVVVGKAYGTTHLMVVDTAGRTIIDRRLVVSAPAQGQVSVYRGPKAETYACGTHCEPAVRSAK
jgi:Flp pilus assembly secretin CpaC